MSPRMGVIRRDHVHALPTSAPASFAMEVVRDPRMYPNPAPNGDAREKTERAIILSDSENRSPKR